MTKEAMKEIESFVRWTIDYADGLTGEQQNGQDAELALYEYAARTLKIVRGV